MEGDMFWVSSEGGPLLLLSESCLAEWQGINPRQGGESDYDRACGVEAYLGLVKVGDSYGIVLDDEPLQTTWLEPFDQRPGMFIRWRYADSETAILRHVQHVPDTVFCLDEVEFIVSEARHFLFDAALPGWAVVSGDSLEILLPVGKYKIQTGVYQPDATTAMILHRFIRQ
jgi:hypothetical protein